jgi:hypothetical protein
LRFDQATISFFIVLISYLRLFVPTSKSFGCVFNSAANTKEHLNESDNPDNGKHGLQDRPDSKRGSQKTHPAQPDSLPSSDLQRC